jgi:hypothetical protein
MGTNGQSLDRRRLVSTKTTTSHGLRKQEDGEVERKGTRRLVHARRANGHLNVVRAANSLASFKRAVRVNRRGSPGPLWIPNRQLGRRSQAARLGFRELEDARSKRVLAILLACAVTGNGSSRGAAIRIRQHDIDDGPARRPLLVAPGI